MILNTKKYILYYNQTMITLLRIQILFNFSWFLAISITLLLGLISSFSSTKGGVISGVLFIIYPFLLIRFGSKLKLSIDESSPFYMYPLLIGFLLISVNAGGYLAARTYYQVLNAPIIELSDSQSQRLTKNVFYHISSLKKVIAFEKFNIVKTRNKNEGHGSYHYVCHRIIPMVKATSSNNDINHLVANASVKLWFTSMGSSLSPGCHIKKEEDTGYVKTIDDSKNARIYSLLVKEAYQGKSSKITPVFVKNTLKPEEEIKKRWHILLLFPVAANFVSLLLGIMLFLIYRKKSAIN